MIILLSAIWLPTTRWVTRLELILSRGDWNFIFQSLSGLGKEIIWVFFFWTKPRYSHRLFRFQVTITFIWIASSLNSSCQKNETLPDQWFPWVRSLVWVRIWKFWTLRLQRDKCSEWWRHPWFSKLNLGEFKPEVHKNETIQWVQTRPELCQNPELILLLRSILLLGKRGNH